MLYRFGSTEISLELLPSEPSWDAVLWYHQRTWPDGTLQVSLGRLGDGFVVRFPKGPALLISADGSRIQCAPFPPEFQPVLLNQVLPYALGLRGFLALHAGVAVTRAGAVAFIGKSGVGKSSLLRALEAARPEVRTFSDDCLIVRKEERGLTAFSFDGEAAPVDRVYLLSPVAAERDAASHPMSGREALKSIMEHSLLLHTDDTDGLVMAFQSIGNLLVTKIRRLEIPRDLGALPSLAHGLLDGLY